ncbi:hypothetical protein Taro_023140 [Colocasia esculenta]|uniref:Hyccin n=1 Tax=Colocasia esculenta TaxID=4460 RepID=A0A843V7G6_COLES|nr:hypothetical protein [Colocasia esculenta]
MSTAESSSIWASISRAQTTIRSLSEVLGHALPDSLTYSDTPASHLLHDSEVCDEVAARLRHPDSGLGDDNLCRWLYDTFQSMDPELQLIVLRFVPTLAGVYLSRAVDRKPLPGFEAVLLALYAHETSARRGQPLGVSMPNLSHPSVYHEISKSPTKNRAVELQLGLLSPVLEPYRTIRATKRARIVGVALEMYCSKISVMPLLSKLDFCEFCAAWAGQQWPREARAVASGAGDRAGEGGGEAHEGEDGDRGGRIPLPWELLQPALRILSHCVQGPCVSEELQGRAVEALHGFHARAMRDVIPSAILATRSLLRLQEMATNSDKASPDFQVFEAGEIDLPAIDMLPSIGDISGDETEHGTIKADNVEYFHILGMEVNPFVLDQTRASTQLQTRAQQVRLGPSGPGGEPVVSRANNASAGPFRRSCPRSKRTPTIRVGPFDSDKRVVLTLAGLARGPKPIFGSFRHRWILPGSK